MTNAWYVWSTDGREQRLRGALKSSVAVPRARVKWMAVRRNKGWRVFEIPAHRQLLYPTEFWQAPADTDMHFPNLDAVRCFVGLTT